MTEREKIAARIRGLLAMTVSNGCTEDEAISAAAKAAEMLACYNLTVDEVQMRASPFSHHTERHADATGERLWKLASALGTLTGARYWSGAPGAETEINFFGFDHEVDVARYLLAICARAMRQEERRLDRAYALLIPTARRRKVVPFLDGMADRLCRRILDMKPPAPTGTGLVVLHDALVVAAMERAGFKLKDARARLSRNREIGYRDGWKAGDRVALNPGLSGGRVPAALLG